MHLLMNGNIHMEILDGAETFLNDRSSPWLDSLFSLIGFQRTEDMVRDVKVEPQEGSWTFGVSLVL